MLTYVPICIYIYSIYANLDNTGDISIIFLHNQPFEFSRNATTATDTQGI